MGSREDILYFMQRLAEAQRQEQTAGKFGGRRQGKTKEQLLREAMQNLGCSPEEIGATDYVKGPDGVWRMP